MTFEEIFEEQARKTKLLISEEYITKVSTPKLDFFDEEECEKIKTLHKKLLEMVLCQDLVQIKMRHFS